MREDARMIAMRGILAILLIVGALARAGAETLTFRNECRVAVVVQLASVHRGEFCRDRPYLLRPGETTTPGSALPGDKLVTIFDAEVPNRVLFQRALPGSGVDAHFRILSGFSSSRVRVQMQVPSKP